MQEKLRFFDAHGHTQFPAYGEDRDAVIKRAGDAGLGMIVVGTQAATSEDAIKLAEKYPDMVWAAVGFHPSHLLSDWHYDKNEQKTATPENFDIERLRSLAKHQKVVAVGECGLDYFRVKDKGLQVKAKQKEVLIEQMKLARELKKPLMIHCRSAFPDLIEIFENESAHIDPQKPGIIHFFSGTLDEAKVLLEMGFYFTFGGVITFVRDYDEVIKFLPVEKILSETDAPYVSPAPYRGKRNEPLYVKEVAKKLAEIKGIEPESMYGRLVENAMEAFDIKLSA